MSSAFPTLTCNDVLKFQFSSWYPDFKKVTMKSTVIRPLSREFKEYLLADGIYIPDGSEDVCVDVPFVSMISNKCYRSPKDEENGTTKDDDGDTVSDEEEEQKRFAFLQLDQQIRAAVEDYGGVFPKLNFSAPKVRAYKQYHVSASHRECRMQAGCYQTLHL